MTHTFYAKGSSADLEWKLKSFRKKWQNLYGDSFIASIWISLLSGAKKKS